MFAYFYSVNTPPVTNVLSPNVKLEGKYSSTLSYSISTVSTKDITNLKVTDIGKIIFKKEIMKVSNIYYL